ncbi:MAG: transcriptional regulator [Novosphingobium sp.]|nr:transcriptional regulator [Novosphingobium sp.]
MSSRAVRFAGFTFDPEDRRLSRGGDRIALNARYLDALALLVREPGSLVTKDRFHDEVWRGVPVTDEALTQCIRTLRRELGDDAARPRLIETVPKHGYRFIAAVEPADEPAPTPLLAPVSSGRLRRLVALAAAGTGGAVAAGLLGGLIYGAILAAALPGASAAAISTLLVAAFVTAAIALLGGAGVSGGIALAALAAERPGLRYVLGGAAGGFLTGALVRLIGLDAFALLFGAAPQDITGGGEGALLGAAAGLGVWLADRGWSLRRAAFAGALAAALAGLAIPLLGGRLMGGSLASLAERFPASRLDLGRLGALFGEPGFGLVTAMITGAAEGALFAGCVVAAIAWAQRWVPSPPAPPLAP